MVHVRQALQLTSCGHCYLHEQQLLHKKFLCTNSAEIQQELLQELYTNRFQENFPVYMLVKTHLIKQDLKERFVIGCYRRGYLCTCPVHYYQLLKQNKYYDQPVHQIIPHTQLVSKGLHLKLKPAFMRCLEVA